MIAQGNGTEPEPLCRKNQRLRRFGAVGKNGMRVQVAPKRARLHPAVKFSIHRFSPSIKILLKYYTTFRRENKENRKQFFISIFRGNISALRRIGGGGFVRPNFSAVCRNLI